MRGKAGEVLEWLKQLFGRQMVRRTLAGVHGLSNRQLNDAGIDLTLAGRGRAADVTVDPNLDVRS